MTQTKITQLATLIISSLILQSTDAFSSIPTSTIPSQRDCTSPITTTLSMCPGGWGIGTPNEMQDGEFANTSSNNQRRRRRKDSVASPQSEDYLEDVAYGTDQSNVRAGRSYEFVDTTQFAEKVQFEKDQLREQQRKDLMEVARMAGFGDRVKPRVNAPKEGEGEDAAEEMLGKFEDDFLDDEYDALDVRVNFD